MKTLIALLIMCTTIGADDHAFPTTEQWMDALGYKLYDGVIRRNETVIDLPTRM